MASDAAGSTVVPASQPTGGGVLKQNIRKNAQYVTVRLNGANQYELVEVFGKVLKSASGVEYAKNYGQRIVSDNPQASYVTWRATISDTDAFILQANIMKMLSDVDKSGGEIVLKGVPYRYTPAELQMLKGIRPGDASSRDIQFVLDRERVRDLEFSQTNNSGNQKANKFE